MTGVDPSYLTYARRRRGMDHDLYEAGYLPERPAVAWPDDRLLAVWIVPILEFFPLDMKPQPINPPGGMTRPYPDYWNYTLRDYGNRVGIYRVLEALEARSMAFSVAVNARVAERYPSMVRDCIAAGANVIAHGRDMGTIHGDHLSDADERAIIGQTRDSLAALAGAVPRGWLSPAMALSQNTTRLVAEAGFEYTCDWINDELPYRMSVSENPFYAMPLGYEISDLRLMHEYRQRPWSYEDQLRDSLAFLVAEAKRLQAGRLLALPVHPWIVGTPQRIGAFERVLDAIMSCEEAWVATGGDILDQWKASQ